MTDREFEMQVDREMQYSYTQSQNLKRLVEKMMRIVRAETGASEVYCDMLLSMLPNSKYKVNMSEWCYRADRDDFNAMLELMRQSHTDAIFTFCDFVEEYIDELKNRKVNSDL